MCSLALRSLYLLFESVSFHCRALLNCVMPGTVTNEVYNEYFAAVVHQRLDLMNCSRAEQHQFRHNHSWMSDAGEGAAETLVQLSSQLRGFLFFCFFYVTLFFCQ